MPDPNRPTGVDYFASDDRFASGTEVSGNPQIVDWQTHADKGVRYAFLKARHARFVGGHGPWFNLNYPLVKDAGLLRAPYHWLDPCQVQLPANTDSVTSGNWRDAALFPIIGDPLDYALQQANDFCDQILAQGWGEPGDLPPAVDIEPSIFLTANGNVVKAVILDNAGRPIFEDRNGTQLGAVTTVGGVKVVVDSGGNQLGRVQNDANGHPNGFIDAANAVHPGRLRKDTVNDLWQRIATPQDRINIVVVWLAQVERRLAAALPGRPVRPVIYTASIWRESFGSPTDNNGQGWDVVHNNVTYHVGNFADYPYWAAQYPRNPDTATRFQSLPTTWATVGRRFIWQYAADPDRNVLVRITNVIATGTAATRNVDVVEETDLTPLEELAAIQRPTAARALTRISPAPIDSAPERSFNVLVIGQGFSSTEFTPIAQRLWSDPNHLHSITDTAPFGALVNRSRVACYADDGTGVFLRMRQTASNMRDDALTIPPDATTLLRDYLPLLKIVGDDGTETTADRVWLQRRQTGAAGGLIVILRNGRRPARNPPTTVPAQRQAELYQLDASQNYPVPVVAVNVTWNDDLWPLPVVRALAQNLAALRDEFELSGASFDAPATQLLAPSAPNLLFIDDATRATLAGGGAVPQDLTDEAIDRWHLPAGTTFDFHANGTAAAPLGGVHLVEGGDGYRHRVLRSDYDCLMRRMPVTVAVASGTAGQPIRANNVPFCRVCRESIEAVLRGGRDVRVGDAIRRDTQRIAYDWVNWATREKPAAGFDPARPFTRVHTMNVSASEPKWSMTVNYNPRATSVADVFQITSVQLAQRPGDPYAGSIDILGSLRFANLAVTYSHRESPNGALQNASVLLDVATALANKLDPPRLELSADGGTGRAFQLGAKLTLAFPFTGGWPNLRARGTHRASLFTIEVVLGLVLTGEQDVDESFPVRGCRVLPQLALRVRRSAGLVTTGRAPGNGVAANVTELKGSVVIEAVNAISADPSLDPSLAPIATGRLGVTVVSASNRAMADSVMAPVANAQLAAASGRKLATLPVDPADSRAALRPFELGPPEWSWRYDYVRTGAHAFGTFVGAYRDTEPKGALSPSPPRDLSLTWPPGSSFQMDVRKYPRQGDYDAVYIHPVDASASPSPAVPVSGDLALVLQLRQGQGESGTSLLPARLGWSAGLVDSGAGTSLAGPLVPPNQHVDLTIENVAPGTVRLTYIGIAQDFRANEWQVLLEQGLTISYRYNATASGAMTWLRGVAGYAGVPAATLTALATALADTAHPAVLDRQVRALFRQLHAAARFYDQTLDGTHVQQAPEATDAAAAEAL